MRLVIFLLFLLDNHITNVVQAISIAENLNISDEDKGATSAQSQEGMVLATGERSVIREFVNSLLQFGPTHDNESTAIDPGVESYTGHRRFYYQLEGLVFGFWLLTMMRLYFDVDSYVLPSSKLSVKQLYAIMTEDITHFLRSARDNHIELYVQWMHWRDWTFRELNDHIEKIRIQLGDSAKHYNSWLPKFVLDVGVHSSRLIQEILQNTQDQAQKLRIPEEKVETRCLEKDLLSDDHESVMLPIDELGEDVAIEKMDELLKFASKSRVSPYFSNCPLFNAAVSRLDFLLCQAFSVEKSGHMTTDLSANRDIWMIALGASHEITYLYRLLKNTEIVQPMCSPDQASLSDKSIEVAMKYLEFVQKFPVDPRDVICE